MKTMLKVLSVFISVIILILSLAFIVIEGRLLFSGDWIVYDSPFFGFVRYLFRLIISGFVFLKSLFEILCLNKESKHSWLLYGDIAMIICAFVILLFATNYVGVVCICLAIPNLLINVARNKLK